MIDHISQIANKYAPLKQLPRSKQKQFSKPWITDGMLKSIKTKQKMYSTHFLCKSPKKIQQYKIYANKLNKLKSISKDNYYTNQFTKCKNNLKGTWKLIGTIIKWKTKGQCYPTKIIRHNKTYTKQRDIANQLKKHFVNAGPHLAEIIPSTNKHYNEYTRYSCPSSFVVTCHRNARAWPTLNS